MPQTGAPPRALFSTADLAEYLGVPRGTVDRWCHFGTGPRFYKVGKHRRFRIEDVDRWLSERKRDGAGA